MADITATRVPAPSTPRVATGARPGSRRLRAVRVLWGFVGVVLVAVLLAPLWPLPAPDAQNIMNSFGPPDAQHWLGADQYGRDLLSRLVWGTRTSLLAAATAIGVAAVIGIPIGLVAGYARGWVDWSIGRIADVVLTVPALVMLMTVQSAVKTGIYGQMVVLGLLLAPRIVRVVRSATAGVVSSPYLVAGRMAGASHLRILGRYVLPNVRDQIVVQASYLLGLALVIETGISFLGIGVQAPGASLGSLLTGGTAMAWSEPMLVLAPAAVLVALILALNTAGDLMVRSHSHD